MDKPASNNSLVRLRNLGVTPLFVGSLLLLTLASTIGIFDLAMTTSHIGDGVLDSRNVYTVVGLLLVFCLTIFLANLYHYLRTRMLMAVSERFGIMLRAEAIQAAVRNSVRTDFVSGLTILQDISLVQRLAGSGAVPGVLDVISALAALTTVFYLDAGFGWIVTSAILLTILLTYLLRRAFKAFGSDAQHELNQITSELSGQLLHPDLVRGLGQLPATMIRWQQRYDAASEKAARVERRANAIREIQSLIGQGVTVAIVIHGVMLIIDSNGTTGLMMCAYMMGSFAVAPFAQIVSHCESWGQGLEAWGRLRKILRDDGAAAVRPPVPDAPRGLSVETVTFWPEGRETPIINRLSLTLPPGSVTVVQGRNGVGKSTLLRLVLGLLPPTEGKVLLSGQDTHFCDRASFGPRIGYLPQDIQLLEADVFTNIGRGPGAVPEMVVAAARAAGAHDIIGRLPMGYQTAAGASAGLSAGQRRLIGLARALYGEPELLVLDEPEVGLDGGARNALRMAVERTRAAGGVVLVVSHEPDTWADIADNQLKLGAGGAWELNGIPSAQDAGASKELNLATIG